MENSQPPAVTPEALLSEVATRYEIAGAIDCAPVSSGLNDIYRITSDGEPSILKVYRAGWKSEKAVLEEVAVLLHVGGKGVPVALPVPTRGGAYTWTLPAPEAARQAVLFTHAKGEPIREFDETLCLRIGHTLAGLHEATDDFTAAPVRFDREQLLDRPLRALEPLLDDRPEDRAFLQRLAEALRERLATLPETALDWGYCHGDFRPANLHLHRGSEALTLFDFETGGTGFRAYDIATFFFPMAASEPPERYERLAAAFLEGYAGRRPLGAADREAIPWFLPLRPIRILGNLLQTAHRNWDLEPWKPPRVAGLPGQAFFEQTVEFLRAWAAVRSIVS